MDSFYHLQAMDVITEPHEIIDGSFQVPLGAGLGVTIDEDRLKHLEEEHVRNRGKTEGGWNDVGPQRVPGMW